MTCSKNSSTGLFRWSSQGGLPCDRACLREARPSPSFRERPDRGPSRRAPHQRRVDSTGGGSSFQYVHRAFGCDDDRLEIFPLLRLNQAIDAPLHIQEFIEPCGESRFHHVERITLLQEKILIPGSEEIEDLLFTSEPGRSIFPFNKVALSSMSSTRAKGYFFSRMIRRMARA